MAGRALSGVAVMLWAVQAHAAHGSDDQDERAAATSGFTVAAAVLIPPDDGNLRRSRDTIAAFSVVPRETPPPDSHRIPAERSGGVDLLPGDRPTEIGWVEYRQQRRREPGAAVEGRMSMRLDTGRDTAPAFGVGGLGGALWRMTDALTSD